MHHNRDRKQELAQLTDDDKFHDECGVVGISSPGAQNIAKDVYFALHSLQHRGQESAGIASNMFGNINYYKDMGLVQEVFDDDLMKTLPGDICIGHARYSTAGESQASNAQPLVVYSRLGSLALAHNGTLVNAKVLRERMQDDGYIFQTTIDSEVIAALIARHLKEGSIEAAVAKVANIIEGAFALVITMGDKLIGVRDANGIRPLCIGRTKNGYVIASESCVFPLQGGIRGHVRPGEIVIVENGELRSVMFREKTRRRRCVLLNTFISPGRTAASTEGVSICPAGKRKNSLARESGVDADRHRCSRFRYGGGHRLCGGIRHSFRRGTGERQARRPYIHSADAGDERAQRPDEPNVLEENVRGKRIIMIDDSIVRGTTSGKIVRLLKDAGAAEVHVRISHLRSLIPVIWESIRRTGRISWRQILPSSR